MRTIKVSELKERLFPDDGGFDCLQSEDGDQQEVSCADCIFSHKFGCGGLYTALQWSKVETFLATQDGDYDLTIDDLALFVTGHDGLDVSRYIRD